MAMIQNQPVEVLWGAFRSDTFRLGQDGWEIALEQSMRDPRSAELFMKHKAYNMYAYGKIDNLIPMEMYAHYGGKGAHAHCIINQVGMLDQLVRTIPNYDLSSFHRVNTTPSFIPNTVCQVRNMPWFSKVFGDQPEAEELIVDPECVQSMLDQILRLQGPMRKEIRARDAKRDRDEPNPIQVHARIISLKAA